MGGGFGEMKRIEELEFWREGGVEGGGGDGVGWWVEEGGGGI